MYRTNYDNYLMHHGVKGMKWGVRHDPERSGRSFKGNLYRVAAANYGLNQRTYKRLGNKTLASMNADARKQMLKKAAKADSIKQNRVSEKNKAKQNKALEKNKAYRDKLANKALKKSKRYNELYKEQTRKAKDVEKHGLGSQVWKDHINKQTSRSINNSISSGKTFTQTAMRAAASNSQKYNARENAIYLTDLKLNAAQNKRISQDWMRNHKNVINMKISATTSKRDIKKQYVGRRLNRLPDLNYKYVD